MSQINATKRFIVQWYRKSGLAGDQAPVIWIPSLVGAALEGLAEGYHSQVKPVLKSSPYPTAKPVPWGKSTRPARTATLASLMGREQRLKTKLKLLFGSTRESGVKSSKKEEKKNDAREEGCEVFVIFGCDKVPGSNIAPSLFMIIDRDGKWIDPEYVKRYDTATEGSAVQRLGCLSVEMDDRARAWTFEQNTKALRYQFQLTATITLHTDNPTMRVNKAWQKLSILPNDMQEGMIIEPESMTQGILAFMQKWLEGHEGGLAVSRDPVVLAARG